jgi:hypothetical protein
LWNAYGQVPSLLVVAIFGGNGGIEYYWILLSWKAHIYGTVNVHWACLFVILSSYDVYFDVMDEVYDVFRSKHLVRQMSRKSLRWHMRELWGHVWHCNANRVIQGASKHYVKELRCEQHWNRNKKSVPLPCTAPIRHLKPALASLKVVLPLYSSIFYATHDLCILYKVHGSHCFRVKVNGM